MIFGQILKAEQQVNGISVQRGENTDKHVVRTFQSKFRPTSGSGADPFQERQLFVLQDQFQYFSDFQTVVARAAWHRRMGLTATYPGPQQDGRRARVLGFALRAIQGRCLAAHKTAYLLVATTRPLGQPPI